MGRTPKALLIWFVTLGVLLSLLGLWAGAQERRLARPVDPSAYTATTEPELPAFPEVQPDAIEIGRALTF